MNRVEEEDDLLNDSDAKADLKKKKKSKSRKEPLQTDIKMERNKIFFEEVDNVIESTIKNYV